MTSAEKCPDHFGGVRTDTAGKVRGPEPRREGDLQASPDVCYVSVLEPNPRCEALQDQSA